MGLLMRYVLERAYPLELDFTDILDISIKDKNEAFDFLELEDRRKQIQTEYNNGVVRCTHESMVKKGVMGSWSFGGFEEFYAVLTNIGIFLYTPNDRSKFDTHYQLADIEYRKSDEKMDGFNNIFIITFEGYDHYFSITDRETYNRWTKKIEEMLKEHRKPKANLLIPRDVTD